MGVGHDYPISSTPTPRSSYSVLEGLYVLHDELGSGGFGKVKLATHVLTQQKVAIKIIDKKAIGDDLPRIKAELEALKTLSHQNICRLYHSIETEEKFFLIMEYCSGGEMFDYIVRKARLEESEARHFFRQLVQGIAYIHAQGFAHRDLKPENLLLTEDLHVKIIDFGLCARPGVMSKVLATCCGSPAYAAPELIQGLPYMGNEADIWSMGVLLYALLCGQLPFEDENMQGLYRKIATGAYEEPEYLSMDSKKLLREMLQVNPKLRIKIPHLLDHPWLNKKYSQPIKWTSIYDWAVVDEAVASELASHHGKKIEEMIQLIKEWKFDYLTATYYIMLQMKRRNKKLLLPLPKHANQSYNIITSPTIHASLEKHLDRSGLEDSLSGLVIRDSDVSSNDELSDQTRFARPLSPITHKQSYANAMLNMDNILSNEDQELSITPRQHSEKPRTSAGYNIHDKENHCEQSGNKSRSVNKAQRASSMKVKGPVRVSETSRHEDVGGTIRPRQIYATPHRPQLDSLYSPANNGTPIISKHSRLRARSSDRTGSCSPASIGSSNPEGRTPRSATKGRALRTRVFASLERKADRVLNLLTPRKTKNESPQVLKTTKGLVNVSITSSHDPERVRDKLISIFEQQEMKFEVKGWKISARQQIAHAQMTVELEVVMVETLGYVGIKRKRLNGDAFLYKKVCEQILLMADIN